MSSEQDSQHQDTENDTENDIEDTNDTSDVEALADTVATATERANRRDGADGAEKEQDGSERKRPSRAVLVACGVGLVAVLVGGGVGYAVGHSGSDSGSDSSPVAGSSASLSLPSTLSSGYKRSSTVDTNIKSAVQSAQKTLGAGTDMALYAKGKSQMLVEATRLPGGALLQAGMTYAKVGDAVCASASSTSGTEAVCTRSTHDLTVEVTANTSDVASKYADEVFDSLA